jgi:predicted RNase H-like nuclease (RuvC/YqgF family)
MDGHPLFHAIPETSEQKETSTMVGEARSARRGSSRAELTELAQRVARLETTAEHLQETLGRIDAGMATMQAKLDSLAGTVAQGIGGLRVGAIAGQAAAGVVGFVAAHLWPLGK